jgi:glycosyltransferase involved in cell wall biosynthesis
MMKVLVLTDKLILGGAEMYFCKLENLLQHPNVQFYYAAGPGELNEKIKNKQHFSDLSSTNHLKNIKKIRRIVIDKQIDIIHANSLRMVLYCLAVKKTTRYKFKIIYTKHNVTVLEEKYKKMFSTILNKHVNRILTVSEYEKNNLVQLGVNKDKIRTIYNGVDLRQFVFQGKEEREIFKVGILARVSEEKNHELFIEIAKELKDKKNLMFYIAGDGPHTEKINNLINIYGLSQKVKMLGVVRKPEQFIREMDLLLLTSYREVFPMVILEAMAVGTPVISIDRGGVNEAIKENQTGLLISDHSVIEFCEKILHLQSNEEIRKQYIELSRKRVETDFSSEKMVGETLHEYLNCS